MNIMRNARPNARPNAKAAAKEASHERIVAVAARAIRKTGYDGTGVADIMKQAGLTHGAFYAHFASRDAMLAEAADGPAPNRWRRWPAWSPMRRRHRPGGHASRLSVPGPCRPSELGCPAAALCSEMPRQAPEVGAPPRGTSRKWSTWWPASRPTGAAGRPRASTRHRGHDGRRRRAGPRRRRTGPVGLHLPGRTGTPGSP